jgi:ABC-2 type transport system ATP-binding protein
MSLALRLIGLQKRYEDVVAVDGIDLEIERGECFGLLGPNGAGKTTTVEMCEGLTAPDGGSIELFGMRWGAGGDDALRQRIGVQLQETQLADKLTVFETLRLFRSFYPKGRDIEQVIRELELGEKRNTHVVKLSGGQRQRLALGCALVSSPELLFLDEPTTGLDPQARHKIWQIVQDFQQNGGTICLTTHYMEEAATLCTRVAIMDHGKVIALGRPSDLVEGLGADEILEATVARDLDEAKLKDCVGVKSIRKTDHTYQLSIEHVGRALPALVAELERQDVALESLAMHKATLEDVFIQLTGRGLRDD